MNRKTNLLLLALLLSVCVKAHADCNVSVTGLNFGIYDPFDPIALDATGTVSVSCNTPPGADVTISIDQSLHSGVFDPRQMKNLNDSYKLNYNLYTDAGKSAIWGDGSGGTTTVQTQRVPPNNKPRTVTIYGSIPPGQEVSVGTYTDMLTATIVW